MRPDPQLSMLNTLAHGPGHCPPELFAGPVDAIVRGLKAHANTISHARHVALEETFPRTRELVSAERFHALAEAHRANPATLNRPLALIGASFVDLLDGAARDLAAIEWAWLEAHGAADAPPFDLGAIGELDAGALMRANIIRSPAARLVQRHSETPIAWDATELASKIVLLTRPRADVIVTGIEEDTAAMLRQLDHPCLLGDLLERDAASATVLVTSGALTLFPEIML